MIWFFLWACSGGESSSQQRHPISPMKIQHKIVETENADWNYPSTGLVLSFGEQNQEFNQAKEAFVNKDFRQAATQLIALIEEDAENIAYHSLLSSVLLSMGDAEQAKTAALRVLELKPSALGYINLAAVNLALNQFDEADQNYQDALEYNPKFFLALRNLASLRYNAKDLVSAEKYLWRLLRVDPKDSYIFSALAQVLAEQGKNAEAIDLLLYRMQELEWVAKEEYRTSSGMSLELPLALGELYRREGEFSKAQFWWTKTLEMCSDSTQGENLHYELEVSLRLSEVFMDSNQWNDAQQFTERATQALNRLKGNPNFLGRSFSEESSHLRTLLHRIELNKSDLK